jgi:hypothetical protein
MIYENRLTVMNALELKWPNKEVLGERMKLLGLSEVLDHIDNLVDSVYKLNAKVDELEETIRCMPGVGDIYFDAKENFAWYQGQKDDDKLYALNKI